MEAASHVDPADQRSSCRKHAFLLMALYLSVGLLTLAGLFVTVHNRDPNSACFDAAWVQTGIFQGRWNELVDFWSQEGYFRHGGLWRINDDKPFRDWVESGTLHWFDPSTFDLKVDYYYRSHSALFVVPLALAQSVARGIAGESAKRWVLVFHNQILVLLTALLVGLLTHTLARQCGADRTAASLLGLCAQAVYQTQPLNLAAYWRLYSQHAFALPFAGFLLAIALRQSRPVLSLWLRGVSVFGMLTSDLPHASVAMAAWVLSAVILDRSEFRGKRLVAVAVACIVAFAIIGMQYSVARWLNPGCRFAGSGILFRTGMDGDSTRYGGVLDGFRHLLSGPPIYGGRKLHAGRAFWALALSVPVIAIVSAALWARLRPAAFPVAFGFAAFVIFAALFSNAMAIHPFAYPIVFLPIAIPAIFGPFPGVAESLTGQRRLMALLVALAALLLVMSQLRDFAVCFPTAPEERFIRLSGAAPFGTPSGLAHAA